MSSLDRKQFQASSAPTKTSVEEFRRVLGEQQVETEWYATFPAMKSADDIRTALESGRAVQVPDRAEGYRLSAKIPEGFRVLNPSAKGLLDEIADGWLTKLRSKDIQTDEVFLVISSLARTVEYQKQLQDQGYPAADDSTHTKLGAFDIATEWFSKNRPELLATLDEVLADLGTTRMFNHIGEPEVGAYHIAWNPSEASMAEPEERRLAA